MYRVSHHNIQQRLAQGPGILGRRNYLSTAILVPLVAIDGEDQLLFEKRASHIKQGGEVCFPGGHFDKNKDSVLLDTALREVEEELGVSRDSVRILGQLDTLVSPRGLIVDCFLGVLGIDDLASLQVDKKEVSEVFTVPIRWFMDHPPDVYRSRVEMQSSYVDDSGKEHILLPVDEIGLPEAYKKNRSEYMHRVLVYPREPEIIWGLTAAVVENFIHLLGEVDSTG